MEMGNYFQNINPDSAVYFHTLAEKLTSKAFSGALGELKRAESINQKGQDYFVNSNYLRAKEMYDLSLKIAEKYITDKDQKTREYALKMQALNFDKIGLIYFERSDFSKALEYYLHALKINKEIGNKRNQASNLGNIGNVYYVQSDYSKALEYYFQVLNIYEDIGDKKGKSSCLGNIGNIFGIQSNYSKALDYLFRALKINEEIGNKHDQAVNLGNIGNVYAEQSNYSKALEYYFNSLKINEEIGNKRGQAFILCNIGNIYFEQLDYSKAMEFFLHSFDINKEIGDKASQAFDLCSIGMVYTKQKKHMEAEKYLKQAEKIVRELNTIYHLYEVYSGLTELYEQTGRYKDALYYYKEYIKTRDSVLSEKNRKAATVKEMKFNFEKEQAIKESEHQKQLAVEKEEKEKQTVITWLVASGLVLVVLFLGLVINRLNVTRKQKNIIEKQKKIVEEQKQIVEEQKKIVEQKNKDILDSINYAKRIQQAILPSMVLWKQHLPDSFVLYLPKDVIAGDFYWMEVAVNYIYVAAADCTGHGVPGAMVSVVCANALTKAVLEEKLTETDQILYKTRELVIEKLTSEDNIRDGMDICLIRINRQKNQIQYSGANRPLYVIKDGTLEEYKPDKQPIGRYDEMTPFSKQEVLLQKGNWVYLTTDGYTDQFGGEKGKKIGTRAFKDLMVKISALPNCDEQKNELANYFKRWKGSEEQMDDVTVVGLKI
jgi:tetratricopeptide (TPR) repeat protein